jgi:hypothetical protein
VTVLRMGIPLEVACQVIHGGFSAHNLLKLVAAGSNE